MDDLYGRNAQLRQQLAQADIEYYGDVPANTHVYLAQPQITYPHKRFLGRGRASFESRSGPGFLVGK
jgi:hypothetical protein